MKNDVIKIILYQFYTEMVRKLVHKDILLQKQYGRSN